MSIFDVITRTITNKIKPCHGKFGMHRYNNFVYELITNDDSIIIRRIDIPSGLVKKYLVEIDSCVQDFSFDGLIVNVLYRDDNGRRYYAKFDIDSGKILSSQYYNDSFVYPREYEIEFDNYRVNVNRKQIRHTGIRNDELVIDKLCSWIIHDNGQMVKIDTYDIENDKIRQIDLIGCKCDYRIIDFAVVEHKKNEYWYIVINENDKFDNNYHALIDVTNAKLIGIAKLE